MECDNYYIPNTPNKIRTIIAYVEFLIIIVIKIFKQEWLRERYILIIFLSQLCTILLYTPCNL